MTQITFLGLGAMGARMAAHLTDAHTLTVWNRTPERAASLVARGARLASSPHDAVRGADVVFSMLTDDDASRAVWFDDAHGALAGLDAGALVLESSTVTPAYIRTLAAAVHDRGAHLLDAPVAGSTPQAEAGQLAFLLGGAESDVARARPIIEPMAGAILHAGPQGHGATLKLIVNTLFAGQVALMAELLRVAERAGLDPRACAELLAKMPVTSPAANGAANLMLAGDHAARFPMALVAKDLRYAVELGGGPMMRATKATFDAGVGRGRGGENLTAVHLDA